MSAPDHATPAPSFPLVATLEALERWQRDPSAERRSAIAEALDGVLGMTSAHGAILEVHAPPLPALAVGCGTLDPIPADDARTGLAVFPLGSHEGHGVLGHLTLDAPPDPAAVEPVVRLVELAVDAAWSRAEVHGRADRLEALEAATRAIAAELDVDRVLQLIVDRVRELIGARYAALGIADARGRMELFITSGISAEGRAAIGHVPRGHGLLGLIIRDAETVRTPDIATHPERSGFPANHPPMTSFLGAPVLVKGRSVGNLYLADKQGDFTQDDERLVEMFAVHAGIAIDNARLHDQVQRLAVIEERERIGKDLHDGIIQAIYAVGLSLEDIEQLVEDEGGRGEAVARVDRAIDALNLVIGDIRSYILRLRPTMGGEEDAVEGLARLTEELGIHSVIDIEVDLDEGARLLRSLVPDRRSDLLFIAREALSNVARHSGATRLSVALRDEAGTLVMTIDDNGRGFDRSTLHGPDALGRHQGLANMRDRAVAMGGSLSVHGPEGQGTHIIVRVPAPAAGAVARPPVATGDLLS